MHLTQVTPICCVPGLGRAAYTQLPALGCWYLVLQGFRTAGWPNQSYPYGAAGFSDCGAIRVMPLLHFTGSDATIHWMPRRHLGLLQRRWTARSQKTAEMRPGLKHKILYELE